MDHSSTVVSCSGALLDVPLTVVFGGAFHTALCPSAPAPATHRRWQTFHSLSSDSLLCAGAAVVGDGGIITLGSAVKPSAVWAASKVSVRHGFSTSVVLSLDNAAATFWTTSAHSPVFS